MNMKMILSSLNTGSIRFAPEDPLNPLKLASGCGLISAPGHLLCRVQTHHRPGTSAVVSTNVQKITSAKNCQACHVGIAKPIGAHC